MTITRQDGSEHIVLIDTDDLPQVQTKHWFLTFIGKEKRYGYPVANFRQGDGRNTKMTLAAYLLQPPTDHVAHHLDKDGLNCSRNNIVIATYRLRSQHRTLPPESEKLSGHRRIDRRPNGSWRFRYPRDENHKQRFSSDYLSLEECLAARDKALPNEAGL